MTDAAVILQELRDLRRLVEALLPPPLDRRQRDLLAALQAVYGDGAFTACEAVAAARAAFGDRKRLQAALEATGARDAQRLGMTLATISKRTAGRPVRLERVGSEGGSTLWAVNLGG